MIQIEPVQPKIQVANVLSNQYDNLPKAHEEIF